MSIAVFFEDAKKSIASCSVHTKVLSAVYLMVEMGVNALAVLGKEDGLAGIITDHDVMRGLVANKGNLGSDIVANCMTKNVITCSKDIDLGAAVSMMARHHIRHLVVVENKRVLGIVGIRELLAKVHKDDELEKQVLRDMVIAAR